jgi:hypothetical protein
MTVAEMVEGQPTGTVAYIPAEFDTLQAPQHYTNLKGEPKVAHRVSLFIEGQGTGLLFVGQDVYQAVAALKLKRGASLYIGVTLNLFRGELTARVVSVDPG